METAAIVIGFIFVGVAFAVGLLELVDWIDRKIDPDGLTTDERAIINNNKEFERRVKEICRTNRL